MYFAREMASPDVVGPVSDPSCGDLFVMFTRVQDGRLADIGHRMYRCPAATCEAMAEGATGKTLDEAQEIIEEAVAELLAGVPEVRSHCSKSAAEALHHAIADYRMRHGRARPETLEARAGERCQGMEVRENATR